ncbi:MAG: class I SAM-dependent methyltransferase [Methylobacteriaceae bacterium]|nr:class I SAM-dependent methyltransferase [Methylobacteriaceae bacterium]
MTDVAFETFDALSPRALIGDRDLPWSLRRALRALLHLEAGSLDVTMPDGRKARFCGARPGPHAHFEARSFRFVRRLAAGDVGFAEGYLAGEWTSDDPVALLALLAANQALIDRFAAHPLARAAQMARHWLNRNSRAGSRRNIHAHYDLGNAFYALWLDPSMTYSAGLDVGDDLEAAQARKYAAIADAARIGPGSRVLEIGCGWGGFAAYAARERGARVTALTISREQFDYATARIAAAGLDDRVEIALRDYRDEPGVYDAVVSIEMVEAVGEAFWPGYFAALARRLAPGARAALQAITIREDIFPRYRREMDFIRAHIFPGGMLPTPTHMRWLGAEAGLAVVGERAFGADYAATCRIWRERFEAAWPRIEPLGFDARFRRLWRYYLAYCEAGFAVGTIDVRHVVYEAPKS